MADILTPEVQAKILQAHGLDPAKYEISPDGTQAIPKSALSVSTPTQAAKTSLGVVSDKDFEDNPVQVAPTLQAQDSPLVTTGRTALDTAPSMAAGGVGAASAMSLVAPWATGAAPATMGLSLLAIPAAGLAGAYGGSKIVRTVQDALAPEDYKKKLAESQAANPIAAELGGVTAMPLGGLMPSPKNVLSAGGTLGKVVTGLAKSPEEIANLMNVGTGTVIGAAQPMAEGDFKPEDILKNAAEGALFNNPNNAIGRRLGFAHEGRITADPAKFRELLLQRIGQQGGEELVNPAPSTMADVQTTSGGIPVKRDVRTEDTSKEGEVANAMAGYKMDMTPHGQIANMEGEGGVANDPELVAQRNAENELRRRVEALAPNPQRALDFQKARGEEAIQTLQERLQNEKDLQTRQLGQDLQKSGLGTAVSRPETVEGKTPFPPFAKANKSVAGDQTANAADLAGRQTEQTLAGISKNEQDKFQEAETQPVLTEAGKLLQEQAHGMGLDVSRVTPELFNTWAQEISALHGIKDTAITGDAAHKGTAHTNDKTTSIFVQNADAGTQPHENFHHIFKFMPERAKQQLLLATKPEYEAYEAQRAAAGKAPLNGGHEEYLATQFGYKAISRLIGAAKESPLKRWWNDTKSLWKEKYGSEPSVEDLYRANTYKLVNGISNIPKGGIGVQAGMLGKKHQNKDEGFQDKEGNQVPLNRPEGTEKAYWEMQKKQQEEEQTKGWFAKMHEAVQKNQEKEEGIQNLQNANKVYEAAQGGTKEVKQGLIPGKKTTYEERRLQMVEQRKRNAAEMEAIRNGAPAREAGRAPLSYPIDEKGYVPPPNAPPRRIPITLEDKDVPIINNVVRAKLGRMINRAGLPHNIMPDATKEDLVSRVTMEIQKTGLDAKAGRVHERGADIEHDADSYFPMGRHDLLATTASRRAQEVFKDWMAEEKAKKTTSLDSAVGDNRTLHEVISGADKNVDTHELESEGKESLQANPVEKIPSKINEKYDTTNSDLAGMLEGMQERFGDDRFAEHIAKLDAMPEGTQLDSKSWIEKNIPKEDLKHQDKEEGIPKEIQTRIKDSVVKEPVYHSTGKEYDRADPEAARDAFQSSAFGMHFGTTDQAEARAKSSSSVVDRTSKYYINLTNPFRVTDDGANFNHQLKLEMDKAGITDRHTLKDLDIYSQQTVAKKLIEVLRDHDYDGLVYKNDKEIPIGATPKDSYVVFDKNQIINAISQKRDEKGELYQDKDEGLKKTGGVTPEQKFNFLRIMPELDKARRLSGAEGKPVADVFQQFPTVRDEFYGKYSNKPLTLASKMNAADVNYVHNWMINEDIEQKDYSNMMNSPAKKALYNATREAFKQKQLDQIHDGEQVRDFDSNGKVFMRDAKINPFYYPSVMRPDAIDAILSHKGDYKRYQNMLLEHWGGVNNPQALAKLAALKASSDASQPNATRFGANRLTEGAGLPAELRVKDFSKTVSKYFNKVATDRAWYNLVEKNPEVSKLINPENVNGVHHEFEGIINKIKGEPFDKNAGTLAAVNRVVTSALLGPMTNIHIGWSTIFNPFQYIKASELATVYPKAMANWGAAAEKIYENGYKRRDLNTLADITDSQNTFIQKMQAVSSLVGKVNGRDFTDRVSKTFAQAFGEQVVPLRIEGARQGDKWSQKLMMQLDPNWTKEKQYSKQEIASMSSTLGGLIHGAHDYRTLPELMTRESWAQPFLSLQSWSVSQTNQWMKHVWEPATQGNFQPLFMSALGAAVGGYVIQQLRQQMMDKKSNIPSLTEIANSSKGLSGNIPLLAYNFMQMASFTGFMGIGSSLAKMSFDTAYKNIPQSATFPLDEAITNVGSVISEAFSAWQQNPTADNFMRIFPQAMIDMAKENVQTARIANNWMTDKGVSTQTENYKYKVNTGEQDLRRYKMAEGQPYDQQTESNNNPYLNMQQKDFKRTTDMREAAKEVPSLVQLAISRAAGNPEILKNQLDSLKQNSYQTMPSPENMPVQFGRYYQYLVKTIGPEAAKARMIDYMRTNAINKAKESMIPSLR